MVVQGGNVKITGAHKDDGRAEDQEELMLRWKQWVPDVNITMSAHDGPSIMMDAKNREKHEVAAKKGIRELEAELLRRLQAELTRSVSAVVLTESQALEVDEDAG